VSNRYTDLFSGVFLFIVSVIMFITALSFKALTTSTVGPDFIPKVISVFIAILSIFLIVNAFRGIKNQGNGQLNSLNYEEINTEKIKTKVTSYKTMLLTLLLMISYLILMPSLGFLIMTAIYLFLQMYILVDKTGRKVPLFIIVSITSSVAIYYVFHSIFHVMLPAGIFG